MRIRHRTRFHAMALLAAAFAALPLAASGLTSDKTTVKSEGTQDNEPVILQTVEDAYALGSPSHEPSLLFLAICQGRVDLVRRQVLTPEDANRLEPNGHTLLHAAAAVGAVEILDHLIDVGANLNVGDPTAGLTPLHLAVARGKTEAALRLIERGAYVNARAIHGITPAHLAAYLGDEDLLMALHRRFANLDAPLPSGQHPIHVAAAEGQTGIVQRLLDLGESIDAKDAKGNSPLHAAIQASQLDTALLLISRGAALDSSNRKKRTPLHSAVEGNDSEAVQCLLDHGAQIEASDAAGWTPLLVAASSSPALFQFLLERGARLDAVLNNGNTVLHVAAETGQDSTVEWLLDHGDPADSRNSAGSTPLMLAARAGHADVVARLLARGADPRAEPNSRWTPLHHAARNGHLPVLETLLSAGVDLNARSRDEATPLLLSAWQDDPRVVQRLLDAGADIELPDKDGITPLLRAAFRGNEEIARTLLARGANPSTQSARGDFPLKLAVQNNHLALATCLLDHHADIEQARLEWTPLLSAAWYGHTDMARMLIERGADLEARTGEFGQTPLFVAARKGWKEAVVLLLDCGADPWAKISAGLTPWHIAVLTGRADLADLLAERMGSPPSEPKRVRVFFEHYAPHARSVSVAGLFNDWDSEVAPLVRREDGLWYLELDLFDAEYAYKFVVDGQWITDPRHSDTQNDDKIVNSLLIPAKHLAADRAKGGGLPAQRVEFVPVEFRLQYADAKRVSLAGEFNSWNTESLPMRRGDEGTWTCAARMRPGEYGYKFVVDGEWMLDPENPQVKEVSGVTNSLVVVSPPQPGT